MTLIARKRRFDVTYVRDTLSALDGLTTMRLLLHAEFLCLIDDHDTAARYAKTYDTAAKRKALREMIRAAFLAELAELA